MIDISKIRNETAGCSDGIFLNSAGSSLITHQVYDTVQEYLKAEQLLGGYKMEADRAEQLNQFYIEVAKLVNAKARNIAFAYSSTFAYGQALSSISFQKGDIIITTDDDYVSNYLQFISLEKRFAIQIKRIKNLDNGDLDLHDLKRLLELHTPRAVAVTHVPTSSGLVQDVVSVGRICKQYDTIYIVDACQSVGQLNVDVEQIGCDFLAVTGRKFLRGPRGTGFLYVSDRMLALDNGPMQIDGNSAMWLSHNTLRYEPTAKRFELFEQPMALKAGLATAVAYLNNIGIKQVEQYNKDLSGTLRAGLTGSGEAECFDYGTNQASIVSFRKRNVPLQKHKDALDAAKLLYGITNSSNARIDFEKKQIDWTIRLSPHYFNTEYEIERVIEVVSKL